MTGEQALIGALAAVGVSEAELTPERPLEQLGIDSFDILRVIAAVEDALGVRIEMAALRGVRTVGDLFGVVGRLG